MRWQVKAALQTAFSVCPGGEWLNYMAQRAVGSHAPAEMYRAFCDRRDRLRDIAMRQPFVDAIVVEIGTGWNGGGVIALALEGAGEIHTYDITRHLRFSLVRQLLSIIAATEPEYAQRAPNLFASTTLAEFLDAARAHYHAPGDAATTNLACHSVDLVFSYDVLEHVPPAILDKLTAESARILRGRACHRINPGDHLAGTDSRLSTVHFLGLSPLMWRLVNNRLSYHNRLRARHFIELFERFGGQVVSQEQRTSPRDLEAAKTMTLRIFNDMPAEELAVSFLDVDVVFGNRGTS